MAAPTPVKPSLPLFHRPPETQVPLDWANLTTIDFSRYDAPGGKQALASELKDALRKCGFWTVVNAGIPQVLVDRQLAIAQAFFALPVEQKRSVPCDFSVGNYFGYREPTRFVGNTAVKENMEMLNIPKYTPDYTNTPRHDFVRMFQDEIAAFHKLVWDVVIKKLFVLFAVVLELPEDYFVERHAYDRPSEDHLRYMIYHPKSAEEDKLIGNQWSAGHTDFGSLTSLFSQSVAALQILTPDDGWKWVKYVEGGITCNAADTLSFMTKGYIKSCIHRVVRPPEDQAHYKRLGLFYFVRPGDDVPIVPALSPVLKREGLLNKEDEDQDPANAVKGKEYVRARVKDVHDRKATRIADRNENAVFQVKNLAVRDYYV
ncbi:hypothetical protein HGRIS_006745 [Hohenbuehelia grisea]|uniref:Flavonol synthase n=1 Tax=Hohenbuehelia grisea TaxID=104357 RepID=A0ABR3JB11_9AGAR